jgi:teichuronic acid biosynthesis glycosyltransferase TuaH
MRRTDALARPPRETQAPATAARDTAYVFSSITWHAAQQRGMAASEDRLVQTLLEHDRVAKLLVCEPFRSAPVRLARRPFERGTTRFPASERAALCSPMRMRRRDPVDIAALHRTAVSYEHWMRRAAARLGLERPALIVGHPILAGFGRFDWAGPVTFYAIDDWTSYPPNRAWWPAYHAAIARIREQGRRVAAVSAEIVERIAPTGPSLVVPNGIDPDEWLAPSPAPRWFLERPGPRLLYVGSLDGRLDVEMIAAAARAVPGGSVTLVGPVLDAPHLAPLRELPNVDLHPPVGRGEVVALIAAADACLIPHARTPLTEGMSPLKLYEYLAGGRPVAASALAPIARLHHPRVALADDDSAEAFAQAVRIALAVGPATADARLRFLRDNAWRRRHEALLRFAFAH